MVILRFEPPLGLRGNVLFILGSL